MIQVFPIGLQALRELGSDVAKYAVDSESQQWKCHGCEISKPTDQMSRCGECKVYAYCSKVRACSRCPKRAQTRNCLDESYQLRKIGMPGQGLGGQETQVNLQGHAWPQLHVTVEV